MFVNSEARRDPTFAFCVCSWDNTNFHADEDGKFHCQVLTQVHCLKCVLPPSSDLQLFHFEGKKYLPAAALNATTWNLDISTVGQNGVDSIFQQRQYCAYSCLVAYSSDGCAAFALNITSGVCTMMSADYDEAQLTLDDNFRFDALCSGIAPCNYVTDRDCSALLTTAGLVLRCHNRECCHGFGQPADVGHEPQL